MRENRQSGSEGGEPQTNAAFLPLSLPVCVSHRIREITPNTSEQPGESPRVLFSPQRRKGHKENSQETKSLPVIDRLWSRSLGEHGAFGEQCR